MISIGVVNMALLVLVCLVVVSLIVIVGTDTDPPQKMSKEWTWDYRDLSDNAVYPDSMPGWPSHVRIGKPTQSSFVLVKAVMIDDEVVPDDIKERTIEVEFVGFKSTGERLSVSTLTIPLLSANVIGMDLKITESLAIFGDSYKVSGSKFADCVAYTATLKFADEGNHGTDVTCYFEHLDNGKV